MEKAIRRVELIDASGHNGLMVMNLVKLCVGVETTDDLQRWIDFRLEQKRCSGQPVEQIHTTRMYPKAADDILAGGSLYWVIKGSIQCRQQVLDLRRFTDNEGIGRCNIVLKPELILTQHRPRRPFQGWRYLKAEDAPRDLAAGTASGDALPVEMQRELAELGLL